MLSNAVSVLKLRPPRLPFTIMDRITFSLCIFRGNGALSSCTITGDLMTGMSADGFSSVGNRLMLLNQFWGFDDGGCHAGH